MTKLVVALAFLALNFYVYHFFATEAVIPQRMELSEFPLSLEDWTCDAPETIDPSVIANLGVTDYLACTFRRHDPDARVGVYIGYHETQVREEGGGGGDTAIHPPRHCLPGSGWSVMDTRPVHLELPGFPAGGANVNRVLIAKGSQRQLVYYWYHSRGRVIAQDWRKLIALFWDRATLNRTDGSLLRFTIPIHRDQIGPAEESLREIASHVILRLSPFVPGRPGQS